MADGKLTQAVISIMGKLDPSVKSSIEKATKSCNGLKVASVAVAGAIAGIGVASAKYLIDLGKQFDGAYDAIRVGTGATGETLEALKEDFNGVLSSVPTTAENASQAIADVNTRLGLTGDDLQEVASKALLLSENLGAGALTGIIEKSSTAFQAWNIAGDDMGAKMDYLFKVSQSTGIGYEELASDIQTYGATLQSLGYDFDHASALVGNMKKAGVDVNGALSAMKMSMAKLSAQGKDTTKGFAEYYEKIQNATTATEASSIATEIFGTKAGAQMAEYIRKGALSVDELTKSLQDSSETINGASSDTMDFGEKVTLLKNKMNVALAPIANSVFDSLNDQMPAIEAVFASLLPVIQSVGEQLPQIIGAVAKVLEGAIQIIAKLVQHWKVFAIILAPIAGLLGAYNGVMLVKNGIDKAQTVIQSVRNAWTKKNIIAEKAHIVVQKAGAIGTKALSIAQGALNAVMNANPIALVILAITALIAIGVALYKNWDKITEFAGKLWNKISEVFGKIRDFIGGVFTKITGVVDNVVSKISERFPAIGAVLAGVVNAIKIKIDYFKTIFQNIIGFFKNVFTGNWKGVLENLKNIALAPINYIRGLFENIVTTVDNVLTAIGEKFPFLGGVIEGVKNTIAPIIESIRGVFSGLIDFVQNVFSGNWAGAWESVKSIFSNVINGLVGIAKVPIDLIRKCFSGIVTAVNNVLTAVGKKFPLLGKIIQNVKNIIQPVINGIKVVINSVKGVFSGIIDFVKNVFTGNWAGAWESVKSIFSNIIDGLAGIAKVPIEFICNCFTGITNVVDDVLTAVGEKFPLLGGIIQTVKDLIQPYIDAIKVVIDSVKGVFSGIIDFVQNVFTGNWAGAWENVKSIFSNILNGMSGIVQAPINFISNCFSGIVTAVDNVLTAVGEKFPLLGGIIQTVKDVIQPFIDGIKNAFESIKGVLSGIIDFVKNIFSGNWAGAWESIKSIFSNVFSGLAGILKAPINAIINIVNKVISCINDVGFTIPEWVPFVGGKAFSLNIPEIPTFATGGLATMPSIVGEGGYPEWVISTDPRYRSQNLEYAMQAMDAVGGGNVENNTTTGGTIQVTFAPNITISGNADKATADDILSKIKAQMPEFIDMIQSAMASEGAGSYAI